MADNDDDKVVPFTRPVAPKGDDIQALNMNGDALIALLARYDTIAIVAWSDEMEVLDVISQERDRAVLYELIQQAASNIAFEALDNANASTFH
jgi:hypothetical protein